MAFPPFQILQGDCLKILRTMSDNSVHCVVTSPPYWGLRSYSTEPQIWGGDSRCHHNWNAIVKPTTFGGHNQNGKTHNPDGCTYRPVPETYSRFCEICGAWQGELGLEPTPELYVEHLVGIFREIRRVLHDDGTLWLNLGDSYVSARGRYSSSAHTISGKSRDEPSNGQRPDQRGHRYLKDKDLCGIPWRIAFALQEDGWYLRSDIIWAKPNPMPESVRDRPTKAHEYLFLLTKSGRYFYDSEAIKERAAYDGRRDTMMKGSKKYTDGFIPMQSEQTMQARGHERWLWKDGVAYRNRRSVWNVNTEPFPEAHFATFPKRLIEPCILAGTS